MADPDSSIQHTIQQEITSHMKDLGEKIEDIEIYMETYHEELFSFVTHLIGFLLSIVAIFHLASSTGSKISQKWDKISSVIYCSSLVVLYAASSMFHGSGAFKFGDRNIFNVLDRCAIFVLIAGTYTPFIMRIITDAPLNAWFLFGLTWGCALVGMIVNFAIELTTAYSCSIYLGMGWLLVIGGGKKTLWTLPRRSIVLLFLGGVSYSLGVVFFVWTALPFNHAIWHLYVIAGSFFHYLAVYFSYVFPPSSLIREVKSVAHKIFDYKEL